MADLIERMRAALCEAQSGQLTTREGMQAAACVMVEAMREPSFEAWDKAENGSVALSVAMENDGNKKQIAREVEAMTCGTIKNFDPFDYPTARIAHFVLAYKIMLDAFAKENDLFRQFAPTQEPEGGCMADESPGDPKDLKALMRPSSSEDVERTIFRLNYWARQEHPYALRCLGDLLPQAADLLARMRDKLEQAKQIDAESATYVESVICMRTDFTGDPPYVGWKGLGLALNEALDERDSMREERDALIKAVADHVTVRGEYYAQLTEAREALQTIADWARDADSSDTFFDIDQRARAALGGKA